MIIKKKVFFRNLHLLSYHKTEKENMIIFSINVSAVTLICYCQRCKIKYMYIWLHMSKSEMLEYFINQEIIYIKYPSDINKKSNCMHKHDQSIFLVTK